MPDPALSDALEEAYASAADGGLIYHTIELYHAAFTAPIYVVRDNKDLSARIEATAARNAGALVTFVGYPFDVVPPDQTATGLPQATLVIDNVSREIAAQLRLAVVSETPVSMIYRSYIPADLNIGPENDPPLQMEITAVSSTPYQITAVCGFPDLLNKRFPGLDYTLETFPGLAT